MQPFESNPPQSHLGTNHSTTTPKLPRLLRSGIFAFPPNRDTLGATSYFIVENDGNILLDCPAWHEVNHQFLNQHGGVKWLFLTHRGGIGKVASIQAATGCEVIIQEQEAYLLPEVNVNSFEREVNLADKYVAIWTPGYSPGSACLYYQAEGGVLFTGRHLLPNQKGEIVPLRTAKTFHWLRQVRSIEKLRSRFSPETLQYICPGANTGFLRGKGIIDDAYQHLTKLDLSALTHSPVVI
ncbi:MBL fold metallo-hydrolase [Oscillatoria salina]|uniref:MBL fold metallo-hydrolase n=1 Tax=Oscillatoria salina TaxID=331517 RepID=UPI001CCB02BB|nr:MBL fold metallo-hydrolase [Oscillatoria salina]